MRCIALAPPVASTQPAFHAIAGLRSVLSLDWRSSDLDDVRHVACRQHLRRPLRAAHHRLLGRASRHGRHARQLIRHVPRDALPHLRSAAGRRLLLRLHALHGHPRPILPPPHRRRQRARVVRQRRLHHGAAVLAGDDAGADRAEEHDARDGRGGVQHDGVLAHLEAAAHSAPAGAHLQREHRRQDRRLYVRREAVPQREHLEEARLRRLGRVGACRVHRILRAVRPSGESPYLCHVW